MRPPARKPVRKLAQVLDLDAEHARGHGGGHLSDGVLAKKLKVASARNPRHHGPNAITPITPASAKTAKIMGHQFSGGGSGGGCGGGRQRGVSRLSKSASMPIPISSASVRPREKTNKARAVGRTFAVFRLGGKRVTKEKARAPREDCRGARLGETRCFKPAFLGPCKPPCSFARSFGRSRAKCPRQVSASLRARVL